MPKHDDPICTLALPSGDPKTIIKMLHADALRALVKHLKSVQSRERHDRFTCEINTCESLAWVLESNAAYDAQRKKAAG